MGAIFVPTKEIFIKCTGANEERPFSFFFYNKNIQIKGTRVMCIMRIKSYLHSKRIQVHTVSVKI